MGFSQISCCRQKCTVSRHVFGEKRLVWLCVFADNANICFFSEYAVHCHNCTDLFTVSADNDWFFAKNVQNDVETHSYEDNAEFHSAYSATALSYPTHFRQIQRMIENFAYPGRIRKRFLEMLNIKCVVFINKRRLQKKVKNGLWKSRACVPLNGGFS